MPFLEEPVVYRELFVQNSVMLSPRKLTFTDWQGYAEDQCGCFLLRPDNWDAHQDSNCNGIWVSNWVKSGPCSLTSCPL